MNALTCKAVVSFSVGCLALASAAKATVIAATDFSSDTTGASLNGQGGGTGWAGNWQNGGNVNVTVVAGSLAKPSGTAVTPSGNTAAVDSSGNNSLFSVRTFGTGSVASAITTTSLTALGDTSDTLYFSYLVQRADLVTNRSVLDIDIAGTTNSISQIGIGMENSGGTDWGIFNDSATASLAVSTVASTTYSTFIAGSVNLSTGVVDIYINPQGAALPGTPTMAYTLSTSTGLSVSAIQPFAESNANGDGATSASYGNFVFGTTFADVVPEPSSLAMLLVPAAALLGCRRRRSGIQ